MIYLKACVYFFMSFFMIIFPVRCSFLIYTLFIIKLVDPFTLQILHIFICLENNLVERAHLHLRQAHTTCMQIVCSAVPQIFIAIDADTHRIYIYKYKIALNMDDLTKRSH